MGNPVDGSGHVTQAALCGFAAGRLRCDELSAVAEHTARCEQCALALAEAIEARQVAAAPAGFDEEVMNRVSSPKRKKAELARFSVRVALAACITLLFIFSGALGMLGGLQEPLAKIKAPDFSAVDNINMRLQCFSEQILNMEVFLNVQETK